VHRELAVLQKEREQHAVDVLGDARIRRELLAERSPVVLHVRRRQHHERDPARLHAALDFLGDDMAQLQGLEPKHPLRCQPQVGKQVPVHERLVRRYIGMDHEHVVGEAARRGSRGALTGNLERHEGTISRFSCILAG
jgi:hypothetical protein